MYRFDVELSIVLRQRILLKTITAPEQRLVLLIMVVSSHSHEYRQSVTPE